MSADTIKKKVQGKVNFDISSSVWKINKNGDLEFYQFDPEKEYVWNGIPNEKEIEHIAKVVQTYFIKP